MKTVAIILASGTVGASAILFIGVPIISRFYEPSHIGIFAIFMATVGFLSNTAPLRLDQAIGANRGASRSDAFVTSAVTGTTVLFIFLLAIMSFPSVSRNYFQNIGLLAGLGALFFLYHNLLLQWNLVNGKPWLVAFAKVTREGIIILLQVVLAVYFFTTLELNLIYATVVAMGCVVFIFFMFFLKNDAPEFHSFNWMAIKTGWSNNRSFSLFGFPAHLVNQVTYFAPEVLLGTLYSPTAAAYYMFSLRMVRTPLSLIGQASYETFLVQLSNRKNNELYGSSERKSFLGLILIFGVMLIGFSWVIDYVVDWMLGTGWEGVSTFSKIILLWLYVLSLSWPFNAVYQVLRLQKELLIFNLALVVVTLGPLFWFSGTQEVLQALFFISLGNAVVRKGYILYGLHQLNAMRSVVLSLWTAVFFEAILLYIGIQTTFGT